MTPRLSSSKAAAICAALACAMFPAASSADHEKIPVEPLAVHTKLDPGNVTVSGISSGAFFAHQFHVAYSSLVTGAGIVAGGVTRVAGCAAARLQPFGRCSQAERPFTPLGDATR